jgi:hypothetical protein
MWQILLLPRDELVFVLSLRKTNWALTLLPLTAFFQQLDAFETFENGALAAHSTGSLET